MDDTLGQMVREYRKKKEMTQLELSNLLGYESMQFVSLFERGISKIPQKVMGKLIVILGIPEKKFIQHLVGEFESELLAEIKTGKKEYSQRERPGL